VAGIDASPEEHFLSHSCKSMDTIGDRQMNPKLALATSNNANRSSAPQVRVPQHSSGYYYAMLRCPSTVSGVVVTREEQIAWDKK